ncbi:delta endotoxin C-terminal domain-containing protein, partial [Bacillus tropicus]|nr:delta endotoxin C-terminal domain-containing protein [Bacillus tropicus]
MVILNDIYKGPYNVLASPPLLETNSIDFSDLIPKIIKTVKDTAETGKVSEILNLKKFIDEGYGNDTNVMAAIFQTISTLIPLAYPPAAAVLPIIGAFVKLIFPTNSKSTFDVLKNLIDEKIDKSITSLVSQTLINTIKNFQNNVEIVENAMRTAIGTGDKINTLTKNLNEQSCSTMFDGQTCPCTPSDKCLDKVRTDFETAIAIIQLNAFENPFGESVSKPEDGYLYALPLFAKSVTLKLSLRHSYITFMKKYRFVSEEVYTKADIPKVLIDQQKEIKEFTRRILTTFNNQFFNKINPNYNSPDKLEKYINYMRIMQLECLDLVALWPFFNPLLYPNGANYQFTRLIFQNLAIPMIRYTNKPTAGHYNLRGVSGSIPNNDIFRYTYSGMRLTSAAFMTYKNGEKYNVDGEYLTFSTNYSNKDYYINSSKNDHDTVGENIFSYGIPISLRLNSSITNAKQLAPDDDQTSLFAKFLNSENWVYFAGKPELTGGSYGYNNPPVPNHKIQGVYPLVDTNQVGYAYKRGYLQTLISNDITPENILQYIEEGKTFTFPLDKVEQVNNKLRIENPYDSTQVEFANGANALKLSGGQTTIFPIKTMFPNNTTVSCQVRIRAATNAPGSLDLDIDNNQTIKLPLDNTSTITSDQVGSYGTNGTDDSLPLYVVFPRPQVNQKDGELMPPTEAIINLLAGKQYNIKITNSGSSDIILDRIEFVLFKTQQKPNEISLLPQTFPCPNEQPTLWGTSGGQQQATGMRITPDGRVDSSPIVLYLKGKFVWSLDPRTEHLEVQNILFDQVKMGSTCGSGASPSLFNGGIITLASQSFDKLEDLEKITNQVNALFTSSSQTELAQTVTDYRIDQMVLKVDALSDDIFGVEKKALRKLVNQAKQLSKARNVLVGGNFEKGHEWILGREAT